jgi:hypothetical protein
LKKFNEFTFTSSMIILIENRQSEPISEKKDQKL